MTYSATPPALNHQNALWLLITVVLSLCLFQACAHVSALSSPTGKPSGVYHTVKKGETLWRICKTYHVSVQETAELNNIKSAAHIKTGDKIFINGARQVLPVPPPPAPIQTPRAFSAKGLQAPAGSQGKTTTAKITRTEYFAWPVHGKVIKRFGIYGGLKHDGINIKAPPGTIVRAAHSGRVVFASQIAGYGNTVIIEHEGSYATVYANNKANRVTKGQWVKQGQSIATVGTSDKTAYLHFQIRRWNRPRNPLFHLPKASL